MSAFVMSDSFFNKLATQLEASSFDSQNYDLQYAVRKYLGGKLSTEKVQALADANVQAVGERYKENQPKITVEFSKDYPNWSPIQLFKNLQCLAYQMSEGSIIGSSVLVELQNLIGQVARSIVANTEEYQQAQWGGR